MQADTLRTAFCVVTEYRSVPGAKQMCVSAGALVWPPKTVLRSKPQIGST